MSKQLSSRSPNPRRVAAGKRNREKWKGLTETGREKLRAAALKYQPWRHSTGPRTVAGKAQAALNGKKRQKGSMSVREVRAELAEYRDLIDVLSLGHIPGAQRIDPSDLVLETLADVARP